MLSKIGNKNAILEKDPLKFRHKKTIIIDSFSYGINSQFTAFESFTGKLLLVYSDIFNKLIYYDLEALKNLKKVDSQHTEIITLIIHYKDNEKKRDLIASISHADCVAKVWDATTFENIATLSGIYNYGLITDACFSFYNNNIFLSFVNNESDNENDKIKLINIQNEEVLTIKNINQIALKITSFNEMNNSFIVICYNSCLKSYDVKNLTVFNEYIGNEIYTLVDMEVLLFDSRTKLIDCDNSGVIRVFDFYSNILQNKIITSFFIDNIHSWENYLILKTNCELAEIIYLDTFETVDSINIISGKWKPICIIKHPNFGKSLLYQDENNIGIIY